MVARRKTKAVDPYQQYLDALQTWASDAPQDMLDEEPKEKLLDAMLRLFETLDANGLRDQMPALRMQKTPRELLEPLTAAIRWQMIGLNLAPPTILAPFAPHVLSLAAARWAMIWQQERTPDMPKLMAAIDRDLGWLGSAAEKLQNFRSAAE